MNLGKDKLLFNPDFGQDGAYLQGDSVLVGVSTYGLDGAIKSLLRGDDSGRIEIVGPLALGQSAILAAATIDTVGNSGADRVSGVVTITTTAAHGAAIGDSVTIAGVTDSSFNGTFIVESVPTAVTFTYSQAGGDSTSGSGTSLDNTRNPRPLFIAGVDPSGNLESLETNGSGALLVDGSGVTQPVSIGANVTVDQGTSPWVVSADGGSFAVTQSGTWDINDISGTISLPTGASTLAEQQTQTTSLQLIDDLVHLDGAVWAAGSAGAEMLAVRQDAAGPLTGVADGDWSPLQVDANGNLKVSGSLTVTEQDNYLEDSPHATTDEGGFILAVRQDTLVSSVDTDGDYAAFKLNDRGALWVDPVGNVADDAADVENPIKVGSHVRQILAAVSATGDRADVISDMYRRLYIHDAPNRTSLASAVTVGLAALPLPATALAGRTRIQVQNLSNKDIYLGGSAVTSSTGIRVSSGSTDSFELGDQALLYAISTVASLDVRVLEIA